MIALFIISHEYAGLCADLCRHIEDGTFLQKTGASACGAFDDRSRMQMGVLLFYTREDVAQVQTLRPVSDHVRRAVLSTISALASVSSVDVDIDLADDVETMAATVKNAQSDIRVYNIRDGARNDPAILRVASALRRRHGGSLLSCAVGGHRRLDGTSDDAAQEAEPRRDGVLDAGTIASNAAVEKVVQAALRILNEEAARCDVEDDSKHDARPRLRGGALRAAAEKISALRP